MYLKITYLKIMLDLALANELNRIIRRYNDDYYISARWCMYLDLIWHVIIILFTFTTNCIYHNITT